MRAMQCLEVVMAAPCHNKAVRSGRSFFKTSEPGERQELEGGYEALVGLYQAVVLGDHPFLNADISHKSFPIAMPMIEYVERFVLKSKVNTTTSLENSRRLIESFLKGLEVIYTPPKSFAADSRMYKVNGLSRSPATSQTFEHEGTTTTVADYFGSRNFKLQYPQLHCLHVGSLAKQIYVPIELCQIDGGQALNVSLILKFAIYCLNLVTFPKKNVFPLVK